MLPTGAGKTLVASMALHTWLQNVAAADKLAVFLAPTSQLTRQQSRSISQFLELFVDPLGLGEEIQEDAEEEEDKNSSGGVGARRRSELLIRLKGSGGGGGGETTAAAGGGGEGDYSYRVLRVDWSHPKYWGLLYKALDEYKQALLDIYEVRKEEDSQRDGDTSG